MKILQIIPAQPGWHVAYRAGTTKPSPGHDEAGGVTFVPIACWALIETASGNRVIPMSGGESGAALVPQDPENSEALGVSPPGRGPGDWPDALQGAKEDAPARPSGKAKEASTIISPQPAPQPKPAPPPVIEPILEPTLEPEPERKPVRINDPEPVESSAVISMDDVMDASFSVSPDAAPKKADDGIPTSDVFDLDF